MLTGVVPETSEADADRASPWLPRSACGPSCIPAHWHRPGRHRAGRGRIAARVVTLSVLVAVLLPLGVTTLLLPRLARLAYWRMTARAMLAALGLRLRVTRHRPEQRRLRGALVVANHISFLDVLAIAAVHPARFVAKQEVLTMGPFAPLLRLFGVLPLRRGELRELPQMVARVTRILDRGRPVAVFPEGTTWCGVASGRFRPAFFQAAIDAGVPVLPIAVAYRRSGTVITAPGYLGDDELGDTLRRVITSRDVRVTVTVHPLQLPAGDRLSLAHRAQMLVSPPAAVSLTRSCLPTSTMPPPWRWSPRPSRR